MNTRRNAICATIAGALLAVLQPDAAQAAAEGSPGTTALVLPAVVPAPQHLVIQPGSLRFIPSETSVVLTVRDSSGVMPAVAELCSTSVSLYGAGPVLHARRPVTIRAGIVGVDRDFDRLCRRHEMTPGDSLGQEGYMLRIGQAEILIAARDSRGLFYGLMTLNQLLRGAARTGGVLHALRIIDWPDQQVRGVMDDISRGPIPTPEFFRLQIRRLAEMKVNTLSYYIEHVVATRSHPEFAPAGAALTIAEWRDLAEFARRYHIDLVGGFQSFGHFEKILAHPRYAHLAEGKAMLSPAYEESYAFLDDIYAEMVPAFSAPFFMTHCDETFDLGKGASKKLVDSLGPGRVYAGHILRLHEMLRRLGVRMMIWGDVLLEYPEAIELIPRDVVIGTWTYDTLADYHRYIRPFQAKGFDVLVTPGVLNSFSVLPNFRVSCANIERFIRDGIANKVKGTMTTVWDDGGSALFARDWYGVAFAADKMWHCRTDTTYDRRFDIALYGDHGRGSSRGIQALLQLTDLTPTDGLNEKNIWQPSLPEAGRTLRVNIREWAQVRSIAREADSLVNLGKPVIHGGDLEALAFSARLFEAAARLRLGVLEASKLYQGAVESQANQLSMSRGNLRRSMDLLASLHADFTTLKSQYATLWLAESKIHALDLIENYYDETIAGLADAHQRGRAALASLERGIPLPPRTDVRLALIETEGWFFHDWLVTGPIMGDDLTRDFLTTMGGEAEAAPSVTQEFLADDVRYRWKRLSVRSEEVDLRAEFSGARDATVYAYATLESPSARTVRALIGVGGNMRVFVNGIEVFERRGEDSLTIDEHATDLPLQPGKNRLLVKVSTGHGGAWGFSFQIAGADVRGRKNRYRIEP